MDIISWIKTTLSKYSSNSTHDKNAIYFVKNEDGKTGKIISDEIVYGNGGDANGVVVESPNQPTGGESVWVNPNEDPEEVEVYNRSQVDALHQSIVNSITSLSEAGYLFSGVATQETDPGTPDAKVFYIANGKGIYEKFGGLEVTEDEVVVLYYDTAWHKVSTGIASDNKVTKLADEEDITRNVDGKLQFKDRAYGGGMGYVILRKDKTFAEQVTQANTIYEIRYNFDLSGASVTIPVECVLKFDGGSLTNGTININGGIIEADDVEIFNDVSVNGIESVRASWFGVSVNKADNSAFLQKACETNTDKRNVYLSCGYYQFLTGINIGRCNIIGETPVFVDDKSNVSITHLRYNGTGAFLTINGTSKNAGNLIKNLRISAQHMELENEWNVENIAVYNSNYSILNVENVIIYGFKVGISTRTTLHSFLRNCNLYYNEIGLSVNETQDTVSTTFYIYDSYFHGNSTHIRLGRVLDVYLIGTTLESSLYNSIVSSLEVQNLVLSNSYTENNNYKASVDTYEIKFVDVDREGTKLTGEYHPQVTTFGGNYLAYNPAYGGRRLFIYLPTGRFDSQGNRYAKYASIMHIEDLGSVNSANFCSCNIRDVYNSPIDANSVIRSTSKGNLVYITQNSTNVKTHEADDFEVGSVMMRNRADKSGVTRMLSVITDNNGGVSFADRNILLIGDPNVRLGITSGSYGISDALALPPRTGFLKPYAVFSDLLFLTNTKMDGKKYPVIFRSADNAVDSTTNWTYHLLQFTMSGDTASRPVFATSSANGFMYFDTDLGKPIWYKGSNVWVDATGADV